VRILGIDPGSLATGYGVVTVEGSTLRRITGGTIRARGDTLADRLAFLQRELARAIAEFSPETAALETIFSARNARSALVLGHARGVALAACGTALLGPAEYTPQQVKAAVTGYGRADKSQVMLMVRRLLGLGSLPPSDEADALAVAICHGMSMRGRAVVRTVQALERAP